MASRALRSKWTFHAGDLGREDVQRLLAFHFEQMRGHSPPDTCHVLALDGLREHSVTFWSMREDGRLLGVGALKALAPDHGEVKSMRTTAEALGRGIGTAMLHHIVAEARRRGYRRLSLETGSAEAFAAAKRLYEREGFVPSGPFGIYQDTPFTRFYTANFSGNIPTAYSHCLTRIGSDQ
jgi:putative acetyltransferase